MEVSGPTSFQTAIRYSSLAAIHEETARAIVLGTDIYYSPNSSQTPKLPPLPSVSQFVRDPLKDSIEEFHNPQWWTMETGYLPFIPTSPHFGSPPFHVLYNEPMETGHALKRRVQMDSSNVLNWKRLETSLAHLFKSFQSMYSIPDMPPIIETSLACQATFEFPSQFTSAEKRCRNWFSIWMAMISFGIAVAQVSDKDSDSTPLPKWYRIFSHHTDESTLSDIRSQLGQFNPWFPRAGVFIDLCSPQEQPSVDFFVRFKIPVWYRWGVTEESHARQNPSFWSKYIPPAHLLQQARSFLMAAPAVRHDSAVSKERSAAEDRPWEVFFANRAQRATGPMPKKKPTLKVYHWEKDDHDNWARIRVLRRLNQETLGEYGRKQKVFDERTNEWDCGTELGELDAEELQAASWEEEVWENEVILPAVTCPPPQPPESLSASSEIVPSCSPVSMPVSAEATTLSKPDQQGGSCSREVFADYLPDQHSPADLLRLFFGFVAPPPSVRLHLHPPSEQQIKDLTLAVGCSNIELIREYVNTLSGRYAPHFFWAMSQFPWVPPSNVLFDLAVGNPRSLKYCKRLRFLHKLPAGSYVFDFQAESTLQWKICVDDVSVALSIVRQDENMCDYQIALALLDQGSPFRTVLQVPRFTLKPPVCGIPRLRLSTYKFSADDYKLYCHERAELLRNPRIARQALMRGGIMWRLAIENASIQDVLAGPTATATTQHQCMSWTSKSGKFYIDDTLSTHEADVISGVYHVYTGKIQILIVYTAETHLPFTGQGTQIATRSWWPPMDLWATLVRQPFWHKRSETWFESRAKELDSGQGLPLTNTQWRARLKINSVVRRATTNNIEVATSFLNDLNL